MQTLVQVHLCHLMALVPKWAVSVYLHHYTRVLKQIVDLSVNRKLISTYFNQAFKFSKNLLHCEI